MTGPEPQSPAEALTGDQDVPALTGSAEPPLRVENYEAEILPIAPRHRDLLHELTVSVFWPHRRDDLEQLIALGEGYIALDRIGRPLGAAMRFPMGEDFATLGMMVTPPRLQAQGAGRRLLRRIMRDCGTRDIRLNATRSGYRLYESAGFTAVATIFQHQGRVGRVPAAAPVVGLALHPLGAGDHDAVRALDAHAFGADRSRVLDALLAVSAGVIARDGGGQTCGFALMRRFGKGQVIGPVVAGSEAAAMQMVAALLAQVPDGFARMDTPAGKGALAAFLSEAGLPLFDTVTEMRIGPHRRADEGAVMFGLAAHSLG